MSSGVTVSFRECQRQGESNQFFVGGPLATLIIQEKRLALSGEGGAGRLPILLEDWTGFPGFPLSDGCVGPAQDIKREFFVSYS